MDFPAFSVPKFGVFDSSVRFPKSGRTEPREVRYFELEFFSEEIRGNSFLDSIAIPRKKGLILCFKPGQIRSSDLPCRCRYIHIQTEDKELYDKLFSLPNTMQLQGTGLMLEHFDALLTVPNEREFSFQSAVLRLLDLIFQYARAGEKHQGSAYLYREKLLEMERFIRENPALPHSLSSLAEKMNLSTVHFHRVFSEFFGMTPNDFVLQVRLEEAKAKLVCENISIAEISADCGFSSQSYFSYKFREEVGVTPLQYRKDRLGSFL